MIPAAGSNITPSFTGFYKVKGTAKELKPLLEPIKDAKPDCFVFFKDKSKWNRTLYILTGKHTDKFVKKIGMAEDFMEFKEHIEKYLGEKAVKVKLKKLKKYLQI